MPHVAPLCLPGAGREGVATSVARPYTSSAALSQRHHEVAMAMSGDPSPPVSASALSTVAHLDLMRRVSSNRRLSGRLSMVLASYAHREERAPPDGNSRNWQPMTRRGSATRVDPLPAGTCDTLILHPRSMSIVRVDFIFDGRARTYFVGQSYNYVLAHPTCQTKPLI